MTVKATIWHNPRCSKSRATLALLEEAGAEVTVRRYLEDVPTTAELAAMATALQKPAIAWTRSKEDAFKTAGLTSDSDDAAVFAAMQTHPKIIERPIVQVGDRAVVGRPPENVRDLL